MAAKNEALKRFKYRISAPNLIAKVTMLVSEYFNANPAMLADMNRAQLTEGLYSDGTKIQENYSPQWELIRTIKGKQVDFVDLNFSGEFYQSIQARSTPRSVIMFSTDNKIKETKLRGRKPLRLSLGGAIGLTQENATEAGYMAANGIRQNLMNYLVT